VSSSKNLPKARPAATARERQTLGASAVAMTVAMTVHRRRDDAAARS